MPSGSNRVDRVLDSTGSSPLEIMEHANIRQPDPRLPVWLIEETGLLQWLKERCTKSRRRISPLDVRRERLFTHLLLRFPKSVLVFDEDPVKDGLSGSWIRTTGDGWLVPADADAKATYEWLHPGGWTLFAGDQSISLEDLNLNVSWSRIPGSIHEFIVRHELDYLLSSFWDNIYWWVGLGPAPPA